MTYLYMNIDKWPATSMCSWVPLITDVLKKGNAGQMPSEGRILCNELQGAPAAGCQPLEMRLAGCAHVLPCQCHLKSGCGRSCQGSLCSWRISPTALLWYSSCAGLLHWLEGWHSWAWAWAWAWVTMAAAETLTDGTGMGCTHAEWLLYVNEITMRDRCSCVFSSVTTKKVRLIFRV